jgi:ElaB/YqjD/DUF883 family membrane-anchored ribosome-binding protein
MCGSRLEEPETPSQAEKVPRFLANARERARFTLAAATAWSAARRRVAAIESELRRLAADRQEALFSLGDATYRGDEQAAETAREQVRSLDEQIEEQRRQQQLVVEETRHVVEHERQFVEPTRIARPEDDDREDSA